MTIQRHGDEVDGLQCSPRLPSWLYLGGLLLKGERRGGRGDGRESREGVRPLPYRTKRKVGAYGVRRCVVHARVQASDVHRTVPINCGYIGTNDYRLEPGDRAFMINVRSLTTAAPLSRAPVQASSSDGSTPRPAAALAPPDRG